MRQKQAMEHTSLVVLRLLSVAVMYGYEMIAALEKKCDSTFTMKEGTLYPILRGLENSGAGTAYRQASPAGRERKYYHLTERGREALREKETAWNEYTRVVGLVLRGGACCAGA